MSCKELPNLSDLYLHERVDVAARNTKAIVSKNPDSRGGVKKSPVVRRPGLRSSRDETTRDANENDKIDKKPGSDLNSPGGCDTNNEAFGSISKSLHRLRIIEDMIAYGCSTGRKPSLVYIGALDGSDSKFFQEQINSHVALNGTRLVAINYAPIRRANDTPNVEYVTAALEDYMKSVDDNTFSHAWLDTTSLEIDNELLWNTTRSTTERVYLVVSLRGQFGYRSKEDSALIVKFQCDFFGLSIKHQEAYSGITSTGGQSNKINMLLFACNVQAGRTIAAYNAIYDRIGAMVDIPMHELANTTEDIFVYKESYLGIITGYDPILNMWSLQFFGSRGNLLPDRVNIAFSDKHRTAIFNRSYLAY